jgi:hypothetical protein
MNEVHTLTASIQAVCSSVVKERHSLRTSIAEHAAKTCEMQAAKVRKREVAIVNQEKRINEGES